MLTSQTDRKGLQKTYKFGGGKNEIIADDDGVAGFGYIINAGGGDDTIIGSDFTGIGFTGLPFDSLTDDARTEFGDLLIGGDGSDTIEGGLGNDTIFGGNEDGSDSAKGKDAEPRNLLFGDANRLVTAGTYTGGNDVLVGGADGSNVMFGDVQSADGTGTFNGGNDILISGMNADDSMVGDFSSGSATHIGGSDTFVFGPNNGADQIVDFGSVADFTTDPTVAKDKINLEATAVLDFAALDTDGNGVLDDGDDNISVGVNTVIDLGAETGGAADVNTITIFGETALVAADFDFTTVIDPLEALV